MVGRGADRSIVGPGPGRARFTTGMTARALLHFVKHPGGGRLEGTALGIAEDGVICRGLLG